MYKIIKNGSVTATTPALCWLKRKENGVFVHATAADGQAILVDDTIYTVRGQAEVEGYEVVDIVKVQDTPDTTTQEAVAQLTASNTDIMDALVELAAMVDELAGGDTSG